MDRYTIAFIYIFLEAHTSLSQVVYERTYPFEFPSIQFPIELSDTSTFALGDNNECGGIGVRHIDATGNELEENAFWAEAFSSGVYWVGHDSVLIWAEEGAYDVGPDSFRVYVWTPDSIKLILSVDIRQTQSSSSRYGAFLYTPDRLVYEKTDTLYTKNLVTHQIEDSLIITGISFVHELEKAILVISNGDTPVLLDDQLNEITRWQSTTSLPFDVEEAGVLDSFLIGLNAFSGASIPIINVYTESQLEIDLSSYLDSIDEVQVNQDQLFVKGSYHNEQYVVQLNQHFEAVAIHKLETPDLNFALTYRYYPDRVYAWGLDGLSKYRANYRMSYKYLEASPIEYIDIALDTMWVDSVMKYAPHYFIVKVRAVVSNHSNHFVHSVTMHYEEIPIFFCDPGVYGGTFQNREVEPNETDTLTLILFTYQVGMSYSQRFYVHHGNHHLDDYLFNNSFHLIHMITSSEAVASSPHVIYPNPFTNTLYAQEGTETADMRLYTQEGKLVAAGRDHLENLERLPSGMYILQTLTPAGLQVNKVIKSE